MHSDCIAILCGARAAGLRVEIVGDLLKISGPKRAEPLVRVLSEHKQGVLRALFAVGTPDYWQERFTVRTLEWFNNRSWIAARRLAWGDLQNEWHGLNGRRWPRSVCAGCGDAIGVLASIDLADGNRIHEQPIDCSLTFGNNWRGDADAALVGFGLKQPEMLHQWDEVGHDETQREA
jgi:hypothetical protein